MCCTRIKRHLTISSLICHTAVCSVQEVYLASALHHLVDVIEDADGGSPAVAIVYSNTRGLEMYV